MCAPGPRRNEQWPHKRLTQTCPWVSRSLWLWRGSAVACCRAGGTEYSSACMGPFEGSRHYLHYLHHSVKVKVKLLSHVWLFATPWTVAYQAPPSMEFSRPRVLEWVAISFSRGSSLPKDQTRVSRIAGRCFTIWATREATMVWPLVNNREGTQAHPSIENWIKDLLNLAPSIRTRPSFPLSQSLPSGSFHSLLSFSIRGQTEWKPQSQETNQSDHMDHGLV